MQIVKFLILAAFMSSLASVSSAELLIEVRDSYGVVGSTAIVSISLKNAQNIGSIDLIVTYDPKILKVVKVEKGNIANGLFSSNINQVGTVSVGIVDSDGINGDGELVKIFFEVLEEGESKISIVDAKAYNVDSHLTTEIVARDGFFKAEQRKEVNETQLPKSVKDNTPGFEIGFLLASLMFVLVRKRKLKEK